MDRIADLCLFIGSIAALVAAIGQKQTFLASDGSKEKFKGSSGKKYRQRDFCRHRDQARHVRQRDSAYTAHNSEHAEPQYP